MTYIYFTCFQGGFQSFLMQYRKHLKKLVGKLLKHLSSCFGGLYCVVVLLLSYFYPLFFYWLVRFSRFWRAFDPKYVRCLLLGNLFQSPEEERKLAKERILWMFECLQFVVFSCFWLVCKSYVWRTLCWCFSIFVLKQNSSS